MASRCTNCKSKLGCSCKRRTTPGGKSGCVKCINQLMQQEKSKTEK